MTRSCFARVALLACLSACVSPADLYLGSDLRLSVAEAGAQAPEPPPPPREPEPDAGPPPVLPISCPTATADCDGDAANGCETDLRSDAAHCGACDLSCANADCVCREGKRVQQCRPGRADCDGSAANGCEVDLSTDQRNCGACGRTCHTMGHDAVTATCNAGRCEITCRYHPYPQIDCDHNADNGCETQAWTDNENCGMCGRRCACDQGNCS